MIAELTGRVLQTETASGGGLSAIFRVDGAEGATRAWAFWPPAEVPRFWQLLIPSGVSHALGERSIAGQRARVRGLVRQAETLELDVAWIILEEMYWLVHKEQRGRCGACGVRPMNQLAHRIPKDEPNLGKYGRRIIHHRRNLVGVCCLSCNDRVSISNHPVQEARLVAQIRYELAQEVEVQRA